MLDEEERIAVLEAALESVEDRENLLEVAYLLEEIPERTGTLRYNPEKYDAYCKYCYHTHRDWLFLGEYWECQICEHGTADEYMQIEGVEPSAEQQAFYQKHGGVSSGRLMPEEEESAGTGLAPVQ